MVVVLQQSLQDFTQFTQCQKDKSNSSLDLSFWSNGVIKHTGTHTLQLYETDINIKIYLIFLLKKTKSFHDLNKRMTNK